MMKKRLREGKTQPCLDTNQMPNYGERPTILCHNHISLVSHTYTKLDKLVICHCFMHK